MSKEFLAELTHIIKTWIIKENLDWEKIKNYELKVIGREVPNRGAVKYCILCDKTENITTTGVWYDDALRLITVYFICKDCSEDFLTLSEKERASIIEKIIEKRIDSTPVVRLLK